MIVRNNMDTITSVRSQKSLQDRVEKLREKAVGCRVPKTDHRSKRKLRKPTQRRTRPGRNSAESFGRAALLSKFPDTVKWYWCKCYETTSGVEVLGPDDYRSTEIGRCIRCRNHYLDAFEDYLYEFISQKDGQYPTWRRILVPTTCWISEWYQCISQFGKKKKRSKA